MHRPIVVWLLCALMLCSVFLSACGARVVSVSVVSSVQNAAKPSPTASPTAKPTMLPIVSPTPQPSATISPSPTASPTAKPTSAPVSADQPLMGKTIGIDAGHQSKANTGKEPIAPNSSTLKMKVTGGTQGRFTRTPEYEVNLQVALRLQKLLKNAGATVVMVRTKNDVNITNIERAQIFNKAKVDLGIRIHCNGSGDPSVHGAFVLVPSKNPYLADTKRAAKSVLSAFVSQTGAKDLGVFSRSDQTGFNWCTQPVFCIEMGHMTNKEEDNKLASASYQDKMAMGIYKGILSYYNAK